MLPRRLEIALILISFLLLLGACSSQDLERVDAAPPMVEAGADEGRTPSGIAFSDEGEGHESVLFVHGWSCAREYWSAQVEALRGSYRVVTIDLGGHGDSRAIERSAWTVDSLAGDVVEVIEQLGLDDVILVGHSMGGPVSLLAAGRAPDRVSAVVGVDSLHNVEWEWPEESFQAFLGALESDFASACAGFVRPMFPEDVAPELVESTVALMCEEDRAEVATALMRDYVRVDFRGALAGAGVPIRAINAPAYPTSLEVNRRYAPDFDVVVMQGVGHFPFIEKPEEFNDALFEVLGDLD